MSHFWLDKSTQFKSPGVTGWAKESFQNVKCQMDFQVSECFEINKNVDFFKISNLQNSQISNQILTFFQDKSTILKTRSMRIPAPV